MTATALTVKLCKILYNSVNIYVNFCAVKINITLIEHLSFYFTYFDYLLSVHSHPYTFINDLMYNYSLLSVRCIEKHDTMV